ncbi:MAG: hypothetical protein Q8N18_25495 [Opitutaceae bacterium]|nr:hypothetical protein [Opitutaceae bacterium]
MIHSPHLLSVRHRLHVRTFALGLALILPGFSAWGQTSEWAANDSTRVERSGAWTWTSHRFAATRAFATVEEGAALEVSCRGRGLVLGLDTLTPPNNYGPPDLGLLEVFVDGVKTRDVRPRVEDREVVLLRSAVDEAHRVRVVHRRDGTGVGCRVTGFRVLTGAFGRSRVRRERRSQHGPGRCAGAPDARVVFVLPKGDYRIEGGRRESAVESDDRRFTVLTLRLDLPANGTRLMKVRP